MSRLPGKSHSIFQQSKPARLLYKGAPFEGRYKMLEQLSRRGPLIKSTAKGSWGRKMYVKTLMQQHMTSWNELEALEKEAMVLRALSGKNLAIPSFVEITKEDSYNDAGGAIYLAQSFVEGPSPADRLSEGWKASPDELAHMASQLLKILQAMATAPGGPIAHNAITPRTIIMQQSSSSWQLKLTGFSSAEQPLEPHNRKLVPALTGATLGHALARDMEYAAPEALRGEARVGISDAYSLGAVLAAAATGKPPKFAVGVLGGQTMDALPTTVPSPLQVIQHAGQKIGPPQAKTKFLRRLHYPIAVVGLSAALVSAICSLIWLLWAPHVQAGLPIPSYYC
ncbi:hypothetical protein WJX74_005944 [Apatococcus lobatus]|uniref:Protein kinase domain-containing protein n=1 Tax=Apatococcus lobatus TaxID=904363 RepID=A0AAW1RVJ6_9CHLO